MSFGCKSRLKCLLRWRVLELHLLAWSRTKLITITHMESDGKKKRELKAITHSFFPVKKMFLFRFLQPHLKEIIIRFCDYPPRGFKFTITMFGSNGSLLVLMVKTRAEMMGWSRPPVLAECHFKHDDIILERLVPEISSGD